MDGSSQPAAVVQWENLSPENNVKSKKTPAISLWPLHAWVHHPPPGIKETKGEVFIWLHSLKVVCHCGRSVRRGVTLCLQSGAREKERWCQTYFGLSIHSVRTPARRMVPPTVNGVLLNSVKTIYKSLHKFVQKFVS